MIGAPAIPREFTDYDALAAFLEDELNAVVLWDEDGAYAGYELVTHISGETFYLAPGSMEPVETDHPELVILGGVTGYVIVGEHAICVDPSKCNPDVPATSAQVQASQLAESIAPLAALGGMTIQGYTGDDLQQDAVDLWWYQRLVSRPWSGGHRRRGRTAANMASTDA